MFPAFLDGEKGKLFSLYLPPESESCKGVVLHVPAFAEEMNKSRHMVIRQARDLSTMGYGVLLFDLFGTGDSEGDFADARWQTWINDTLNLIDWLAENIHSNVTLWGVRLGGLLAAVCASQSEKVYRLVLWQPVINGEQFMQQFLRLRLAASMMGEGEKETVKSLKVTLVKGEPLEVAGYVLDAQLFSSVVDTVMNSLDISHLQQVAWFEVNSVVKPLAVPSQKLIASWQENFHFSLNVQVVEGKQFWSNQEIVWAEHLINQTTLVFAS